MIDDAESAKSLLYHAGTTLEPLSGKVVPDPPTHPERVWGSEPATTPEPAVPLFIALLKALHRDAEYLSRNGLRSMRPTWELRAEALAWAITQLTTTETPNG